MRLAAPKLLAALLCTTAYCSPAWAQQGLPAVVVENLADGGQSYSLSLQTLIFISALSLLPAFLLMMTSFTRVIITLAILRQALGTAQTPSNQILIGLALFLTLFIMTPVFDEAYNDGIKPFMDEQVEASEGLRLAAEPFRAFMFAQTREDDLALYLSLAQTPATPTPQGVPFTVLLPSFVTSELKTAFQIGFLLFIPFLIIDLVVASVLMSMGMMMLSPLIISLPFKLMLFVLVDGWSLVLGTLASSFFRT